LLTPLLTVGLGLLYGSFRESNDASTLKAKIATIGTSRNIRGIARE
jgi:cell division protein FtsN